MSKVLAAAIGIVAAASLAACGSDNATGTATASLKAELLQQSQSGASAFTFSDAQAQCTASRIAQEVGAKQLQQYGLLDAKNQTTPKTLDTTTMSAKDATTVVDAIINCLGEANFTKALADAVDKSIPDAKSQAQRDCLQSKLTIVALKPMLIASLSGDSAPAQKFSDALLSCVPAS